MKQCKACPWKKSTVPDRDIPKGYSCEMHEDLRGTIAANPWSFVHSQMHWMACHESPIGRETPCVGWVANQLGPGNNIALRIAALDGRFKNLTLDGEQHETFEDTLPKKRARKTRRRRP